MTTPAPRSLSVSEKARPVRSGVRIVVKYSGVIARRSALSRWFGGGGGKPSTVSAPDELLPDNGSTFTAAAPVTPGMLAMSDTALATNARRDSSVEYFHSGRYAGAVTTLVGSKPG